PDTSSIRRVVTGVILITATATASGAPAEHSRSVCFDPIVGHRYDRRALAIPHPTACAGPLADRLILCGDEAQDRSWGRRSGLGRVRRSAPPAPARGAARGRRRRAAARGGASAAGLRASAFGRDRYKSIR